MAGSGFAVALTLLVLLPCGVLAATLPKNSFATENLVRREADAEPEQASITADGDVTFASLSRHTHHKVHQHTPQTMVKLATTDMERLKQQYCNTSFSLGPVDTDDCAKAGHRTILDEEECIFAATLAGATTSHASFKLSANWTGARPQGCFKYECSEAANKVCFFYNGGGPAPTAPKGVKVCSVPKFEWSPTPNTNGGCPDGYQAIDDEDTCHHAATCLDVSPGTSFRVGVHNASKHLEYPRGCFKDSVDGKAYYNGASKMGDPTGAVKGTILCNVTALVSTVETAVQKVEAKVDAAKAKVEAAVKR